MKQIVQNLKTGITSLEEVPAPMVRRGHVLIQTHRSLVSLGTEKMLVDFSKGNLFSKARQQPEKVKQVIDKIKSDGLKPTLEAVFNKLDEPMPLGYCNAGEVIAVGADVVDFKIGDRVVSNGHHAEIVCVPKNLCARIPNNVSYEDATFTVIGAIGLQGIRLAQPTMGECFVVIGLGLIGLITVDLLLAQGCDVICFDIDDTKVQLASKKGAQSFNSLKVNPISIVDYLTNQIGADAVIITATSKSDEIISQSAQMCRKRGRIILVGVVGLNIQRSDFYKKELTFQVSCSYGPGRYDENYEHEGIDYPLPYVRWTEKRNFETILSAIANEKLQVKELITEQVPLSSFLDIYGDMNKGSIASILEYEVQKHTNSKQVLFTKNKSNSSPRKGSIGIIGAGNFTKMIVLPVLKKIGAEINYIASASGLSASTLAKKYLIQNVTSQYQDILSNDSIDTIFITTRHHQHASMVVDALKARKHVFVEKPLAINQEQLTDVHQAYLSNNENLLLHVGYNRRFAPLIQKAKSLIGNVVTPISMTATINAGFIPNDVWIHHLETGGGRIIGEACHFIDLMIFLSNSKVTQVMMTAMGLNPNLETDTASILMKFENGSIGVINYFANGNKSYSKERFEIFDQGKVLILDNFRKLEGFGFKGFSSISSRQDKGHLNQFDTLLQAIRNETKTLIPFEEIYNSTQASLAALKSLQTNQWIQLD